MLCHHPKAQPVGVPQSHSKLQEEFEDFEANLKLLHWKWETCEDNHLICSFLTYLTEYDTKNLWI